MSSRPKRKLAPVPNETPTPEEQRPSAPDPRFVALAIEQEQLKGTTGYLANLIAALNDDLLQKKVRLAQVVAELQSLTGDAE